MRTDSNLEPVWRKLVPNSCVMKQSLREGLVLDVALVNT